MDPEPNDHGDWLDQMLGSRVQLQSHLIYLWFGGYEVPYVPVPLVPISEFQQWTPEQFLTEYERRMRHYRGD